MEYAHFCSTERAAEVNLYKTSLSESGEVGCILLFLLTVLYLAFSWDIGNSQEPVLPHFFKWKKLWFLG